MQKPNPEFINQLSLILAASGREKVELIERLKRQFPEHKQWLETLSKTTTSTVSDSELPNIDGYEILSSLGSGANGQVYLAVTKNNEKVAIKIPNVWLNSEQIQRFKHESELLRRLNHPSIAQIYSVGEYVVQGNKMPYMVMEYVDGTDIKSHCQQNNLSQKACVAVMMKVLDAIQHAHQNRVIHRDLKPENIVVDSNGTPKVIDFGIATLSDDATRALTQLTKTGEVVGTLSYMSPEQVTGSDNLDSRSDVYSCGVMLYELLVNQLPHQINPAQLFSAISAIVDEPIKPISQHTVKVDDSLAAVIHHALEKSPEKRFQSAHEFAKDLARWSNNEPVESVSLSKFYWIKQAAKKNKALVLGTALAFAGLFIGLVFAISFAMSEKEARNLAETRAESNRKAVAFINDLFESADPGKALGELITVKQVVSSANYAVDKSLSDEPQVAAQIRLILGNVNFSLERFDEAERNYAKALSLISDNNEIYPELITQKIRLLGATSKFDQQLQLIENSEVLLESANNNHLIDRITIEKAANFASNNKLEEAEELLQALLSKPGVSDAATIAAKKQLGRVYRENAQFKEAYEVFSELVDEGIGLYGELHPLSIDLRQEEALSLRYLNRLEEAVAIYLEVVADAKKAFTDESLTTLLARVNLTVAYMYQGDFARAEKETADILPKMIKQLGPLHQYTMSTRNIRAGALDNLDRVDEAIELYEETLAAFAESENKVNPTAMTVEHNMAIAYTKKDDYDRAAQIYDDLIPRCFDQLTKQGLQCAIYADSMAEIEMRRGRIDEAEAWLDYSTPLLLNLLGETHFRVKSSRDRRQKLIEVKSTSQSN